MGPEAELSCPAWIKRRRYSEPDYPRAGPRQMAHPEPTGEEEEHHGSPWPVIIAIGMGVGYVGIVSVSIPMLLVGLAILGGGLGGWSIKALRRHPAGFI